MAYADESLVWSRFAEEGATAQCYAAICIHLLTHDVIHSTLRQEHQDRISGLPDGCSPTNGSEMAEHYDRTSRQNFAMWEMDMIKYMKEKIEALPDLRSGLQVDMLGDGYELQVFYGGIESMPETWRTQRVFSRDPLQALYRLHNRMLNKHDE